MKTLCHFDMFYRVYRVTVDICNLDGTELEPLNLSILETFLILLSVILTVEDLLKWCTKETAQWFLNVLLDLIIFVFCLFHFY